MKARRGAPTESKDDRVTGSDDTIRSKADRLFEFAQALAREREGFFTVQGPGAGDRATLAFMSALRRRAAVAFSVDCAEKRICGPNGLCVDYFFPEEETIVEIALGLRNPLNEYERDIFKALIAMEAGHRISRLVFISKPGAAQRLAQPGARAIAAWAEQKHALKIFIHELKPT